MSLDRGQVVEAALQILREHGLSALSMRRLATELGVAPGAIYWHVPSKQDLLAEVAATILAGGPTPVPTDNPRQAAYDLRAALLQVRDGAEVVSFALALRPDDLVPLQALARSFAPTLSGQQAEWAARTLIYYVLGAVAEEQNRDELARAGIVPAADRPSADEPPEAFVFGVRAVLAGLGDSSPDRPALRSQ